MSIVGRVRKSLVFLVLAVLCGAGASGAPTASAEPLGAVTGPVTETVTGPVQEVVEALPPPVQEATEAVTAPVQEATQVAPPVQEVTEAATAPVEAVKETVKPPVKAVTETVAPPAKAVTEAVRHPSASPPVKLPSVPTTQVAGTVGKDLSTSRGASSSSSSGADPTSPQAGSTQDLADQGSAAPLPVDRTRRQQQNRFVPSPAIDGSTMAPLPKWMAYIWPAIALFGPGLSDSVHSWASALRISLEASEGLGETAGTGPVVAGVHATGGRSGQADSSSDSSSSSPFSKITTAVGDFPYNGAGAALAYLLIVAIMVIALYGAVRWEIARSRREGRG
jgi:hypothetical protein